MHVSRGAAIVFRFHEFAGVTLPGIFKNFPNSTPLKEHTQNDPEPTWVVVSNIF